MTINTQLIDSLGLGQQGASAGTGSTTGTKNTDGPTGSDSLGQSDFLKLMVTQLNNQDPTKPMDSGEFYTQIAQFSTVAGIQDLQNSFAQVATAMYSSQALQASAMVGRDVLVPGDTSTIAAGGMMLGTVSVPSSASDVQMNVYDASGQVVRTLDLGAQSAGDATFVWDGTDAKGNPVAAGTYKVVATTQVDGQAQALSTSLAAQVESVSLGKSGQGITLNLSGVGAVALSDVEQVM